MKPLGGMILFVLCLCGHLSAIAQITQKELSDAGAFTFSIYKQIHQKPELGKAEFETSALITSNLKKSGYTEFHSVPDLPTAVIAVLDTKRNGAVIALRAELDARPGKEATGLPYSSQVCNVMHSCGHDAHTAILLSTASLLHKHAASLSGKIVFIFQPAEEIAGGADDIVNSGILKTLKVEKLYALHCYEGYPVGTINICPGYVMAGSNYFTIDITGKGSHAGFPFRGDDIPVAVSELVHGLSELPARKINISERPCVISTTYIQTGDPSASNVLPESARFKGTVRAYEDIDSPYQGQPSIRALIESYVEQFCKSRNLTYEIDLKKGSPPTRNDEQLYDAILPMLRVNFSGTVDITPYKSMAAEDFSYYTNQVPCLYFSLGIAKDPLGKYGVHTSRFSVHPDAFQYGIELMTFLAGLKIGKVR
jgi:amidohydrolase